MLFNSFAYAVFLPLVLIIYYSLKHKQQNYLLLAASYFFYGFWNVKFLSLIFISTIIDYLVGLWVYKSHQNNNKFQAKMGLITSLACNLGILGFFKYYDFFIESANQLLSQVGLSTSLPLLNVLLPVGISFYTFQTLSYTFDIYRQKLKPTSDFVNFALFVSFFPQLVAGPIERAVNLLPQIEKKRVVTSDYISKGLYLILIGLIRKIVIADTAGVIVDIYFANPSQFNALQLIIGLFLYALQIYGDFAGYSNIARGSAFLMGFDLMRNFEHPYFATNITLFWRKWHISLSQWLKDYLYIALGGNRKGKVRTFINLILTMLLGGLWHGASWNFVFWGFLHGFYLAVHKLFRNVVPVKMNPKHTFYYHFKNGINIIFTLCLVNFTWLFFRSHSITTTVEYLRGFMDWQGGIPTSLFSLAFLSVIILIIDVPQAISKDEFVFLKMKPLLKILLAAAGILLLFFSGSANAPFIYFQF